MKRIKQVIWGVIFVCIGLLLGLNAMDVIDVTVFFDGWWTLFIIVPCVVGLITEKEKMGNLIGLLIGVFLLLGCQGILTFGMMWKLLFPIIIVLIGIKLIFGNLFSRNGEKIMEKFREEKGKTCESTAIFSGEKMDFSGEVFQCAELNAVFGGLQCDLRNAIINEDCAIEATAVFGGIDIFVPNNINVKTSSSSVFGGVTNKTQNCHIEGAPTLYIKGTCMFGGVDIK